MAEAPADKSETPVEVLDLRKSFGAQQVLKGISLSVPRGQTLTVLGRSGGGKSVLLRILIGLQAADSGSVKIEGTEIGGLEEQPLNEVRKKMGFVFQQAALYDSMTVEQNIDFPLSRHAQMPDEERRRKVRELLTNVGLEERDFNKMPALISGGMQKRVGLARALALDPEILLLDEPTAGLDPVTAHEIGQLIVELKKKRHITAVVVTHDIPVARMFSERMVLLNDGAIAASGSYDELRQSKDEFVSRFLGEDGDS